MSFREHTTLGRTGLEVSRLGIGSGYGVPAAAVERAFHEYGINYLYWSLARRGGMTQAIRNLIPAHRDELVIAMQTYDHVGPFMRRGYEKGLRKLGIDCADVLILGWFNRYPGRRILDTAERLKEEGKVRYLAMSGHHRPTHGRIAAMTDTPIDILMVRYNPAHRGAEKDVFPHPGEEPLTAADCYRFALSSPHVDLCLIGPKNDREMDGVLGALDVEPLLPDELERIRRIGDHVHG